MSNFDNSVSYQIELYTNGTSILLVFIYLLFADNDDEERTESLISAKRCCATAFAKRL